MRHLVAVCIISCLAINPALANKFAACGFIEFNHPDFDCTAVGVTSVNDFFGLHYDDPKTGKKYGDIVLSGKECAKMEFTRKYSADGKRLLRKKIGTLFCDEQTGKMYFNRNQIYKIN